MGFAKLIDKVTQAERALEARERNISADWKQLKSAWRAAWTPGRIVVAGLASGFLIGRVRPLRGATGGGFLHLMSALSGLVASGSAQVAADEAGEAAEQAEATAEAANVAPANTASAASTTRANAPDPLFDHEALRRKGLL